MWLVLSKLVASAENSANGVQSALKSYQNCIGEKFPRAEVTATKMTGNIVQCSFRKGVITETIFVPADCLEEMVSQSDHCMSL